MIISGQYSDRINGARECSAESKANAALNRAESSDIFLMRMRRKKAEVLICSAAASDVTSSIRVAICASAEISFAFEQTIYR